MKLAALLAALALCPFAVLAEGELEASQREMTAAYATLAGTLDGAARAHLEGDQARWLTDRRACDDNPAWRNQCLELRYRLRADLLKAFAKGPYPFISEQAVIESGKGPDGRYAVDIDYPRFDGTSADFSETNRRFTEAGSWLSDAKTINGDVSVTQDFAVYRLSPTVVSVTTRSEWTSARVTIALAGYLVDLGTGRILEPQDVFASGDGWRRRLADLVRRELEKDPDPNDKSRPVDVAAVMAQVKATDYLFETDALTLSLPEVALARAMKGYTVDIPYVELRGYWRADGPLGGMQK